MEFSCGRVSDYKVLAEHYDRVYNAGSDNRAAEIAMVTSLVDYLHPQARSVLDLGTGTGAILKGVEDRFDELVGLDLSGDMLEIARRQVSSAEFIEADMADFDIGRQFDVVICLFDAINHLRNFKEWQSLFRRAEQHLTEDGLFVFDVATTGLLTQLAEQTDAVSWPIEGGTYHLETEAVATDRFVTHFTIELDEQDGGLPQTTAGEIHQTAYPIEQVKDAAGRYLNLVLDFEAPNAENGGDLTPATDTSGHPVFVYEKPPS